MVTESPGWSTILNSTMPDFIRKVMDNILRERILLMMMERNGRVTMNHSGTHFNWKAKYRRAPMNQYSDGDTITFARQDRYKTATLNNDRGYQVTDSMSTVEKEQNKGTEAIINLWGTKMNDVAEDLREQFCNKLYANGEESTRDIDGIESFLSAGDTPTVAAPGFVLPDQTYAGLETAPGYYGGNYEGVWPNGGTETPQYDFWSPILVDYESPVAGAWNGVTDPTWFNTCNQALNKIVTKTKKKRATDGRIDLILLEETLFQDYRDAQEHRTQLRIESTQNLYNLSLGFDTMQYNGVTIATEYDMPLYTGYCFNTRQMELKSLQSELFVSNGPFFHEDTVSWRWLVMFLGNLVCDPGFFGKLYNYALAAEE